MRERTGSPGRDGERFTGISVSISAASITKGPLAFLGAPPPAGGRGGLTEGSRSFHRFFLSLKTRFNVHRAAVCGFRVQTPFFSLHSASHDSLPGRQRGVSHDRPASVAKKIDSTPPPGIGRTRFQKVIAAVCTKSLLTLLHHRAGLRGDSDARDARRSSKPPCLNRTFWLHPPPSRPV